MIVVMLIATGLAFGTARRVVQENEHRLLTDRASDVGSLLESLGTSYEAQMASVAAVAQVTDGDLEEFAVAVEAAGGAQGGWALLRHTPDGYEQVGAIGTPTPVASLPAEWTAGLDRAMRGHFAVLGFTGDGFDRRFAMVSGRTGVPGELVVYNEASLLGATSDASQDSSVTSGLAIAVYIGDQPDVDELLFAVGDLGGHVERRRIDIGGTEVLLEAGTREPLAGSLATNLPRILLAAGLLLCFAVSSLVEITLRRRDDALAVVSDLEEKNLQLDRALDEQRAAEEARATLEAELRQSHRLEALGHLAGGVAHDFNNLLAAILSYADLAADGLPDPQATEDLEQIRSAARRGAALTGQLLQFSRREPLEPVAVDVNERVRDLSKMLARTLGEDVTLRTVLTTDPTRVMADPHELDQVLLNLVVNSRDALEPGGSIVVSTGRVVLDEQAAQQHPGLAPGAHVRLVVRDDGHGMTPEVLEHAFEPFFTTKGRGQGTGLGLATAYGIVQRHNGHIAARSAAGDGTEIEVLLPASEEPSAATPEPAPPAATWRGVDGRTVLLVEDEAPVRRALRRMLERSGYRVLEAEDGGAAVERYGATDIDLLLTDLVMPGSMTGVDVASCFRDRVRGLPVVFMTGYGADLLDAHGLEDGGGASVLSKPFSEDDLLSAVRVALEVPR